MCVVCTPNKTNTDYNITLQYTQHKRSPRVTKRTAHITHTALESQCGLQKIHIPPYSLTLNCKQHTPAALESHSALHTTHAALH